jgi:hypothetical protein
MTATDLENFRFLISDELGNEINLAQQGSNMKISLHEISPGIQSFTCYIVNEITETGIYNHLYSVLKNKLSSIEVEPV